MLRETVMETLLMMIRLVRNQKPSFSPKAILKNGNNNELAR